MSTMPIFLRLSPGAEPSSCPKCSHPSAGKACPKCGLLAARAASYVAPVESAASPELLESWRDVRRSWHDLARHEHVMRVAGRHNAYAWLASRYREIARRGDELASQRLALVGRAAELTFAAGVKRNEEEGRRPYAATRNLMLALMVSLALAMVLTKVAAGIH